MGEYIKTYYQLAKPGIIYGNLLTTAGGFLFGAILRINLWTLLVTLAGTALIIGSGCVINNYIDRDIDAVMKRTKRRALVTGNVPVAYALIYAVVLGATGIALLAAFTNNTTTLLGITGLVTYTTLYTYAKRITVHSTLIGTLPGAIPPVAGYTAATNQLDVTALLLFLIMVCWQMVHFYSISIFRIKDYKAAKIPVMSVKYGVWVTKLQICVYGALFLLAVVALAKFSYAGLIYLAIMFPLSLWWIFNMFLGLWGDNDEAWSRKVFFISLLVLLIFSVSLAINAWLP